MDSKTRLYLTLLGGIIIGYAIIPFVHHSVQKRMTIPDRVYREESVEMTIPKSGGEIYNADSSENCDMWAVVTTIFQPSDSVRKVARHPDWCMVIVGDKKTPSRKEYLDGLGETKNVLVFLNTQDQDKIFPLLSKNIPWNHFARKNIGYMYAIKHGARYIWDYDDDNINIPPVEVANTNLYRAPCEQFSFHLFNPYRYFNVNETHTWPRGFPLEEIRNAQSVPKLCKSSEKKTFGVVQSLANIQPDVDAIYRFTRDTPFNFGATPKDMLPVIVPAHAYTPFNGQATLWMQSAFLYLALPASVSGRVSDIWRSYIAEYFFYKTDLHVLFTPPYVDQHRNLHDYLKDFNDELDLYQRSRSLVKWLSQTMKGQTVDLKGIYKQMVTQGHLREDDIRFIVAWVTTYEHQQNSEYGH